MKTRLFLIAAFLFLAGFINAQENKASVKLAEAIYEEEVTGNLDKAVELYLDIINKYPDDRPVAAKALYHLGLVNEKMGRQKARDYYTRLVNSYPDQTEVVALAKAKLRALSSPAQKTLTARRLDNPPADIPIYGAISPDGQWLSYWDWRTGNLTLRDLQTGKDRPLTNEGTEGDANATDYQSAGVSSWSADSKKIVYIWHITDSEGERIELRIVNLEGDQPVVLSQFNSTREINGLSWSPDAEHIAFVAYHRNGVNQLMMVSTDEGSTKVLTDLKREIYPTTIIFSPDSRYIAYDFLPDTMSPQRDIYLMNIDSKITMPLIRHSADDFLLGWSADGQWLVFASDRAGSLGLWIIGMYNLAIQGEPQLIKSGIDRIVPISMTRGGELYYGVVRVTEDIFIVDIDPTSGKVISSPRKMVESYEGGNFTPRYSHDGKYMAYVSRRGNSPYPTNVGNALCIRSIESGEESVFYKEIWRLGLRYIGGPTWSPDGRYIVFGGSTGNSLWNDYRINMETGEINTIYRCGPDERISGGAYGPDGRFFSARIKLDSRISGILMRDLNSGEEKELFSYPWVERGIRIALSPDYQSLAFSNAGWGGIRSINILPVSGGEAKEIWSFGETEMGIPLVHLVWSPDGKYIMFSAPDPNNLRIWELWRISEEGGKPEKMGLQRNWGMYDLTVSPDGRQLAFAGRGGASTDSELWVLENFLPEEKIEADDQLVLRKLDYPELTSPFAEFSPDGKKVVQEPLGKSSRDIELLDLVQGTKRVLVKSAGGGLSSTVWSPESDKIAYRLNGNELHICDIESGKSQLFYKSTEYNLFPTDWSRDGEKILCLFNADNKIKIGTISTNGRVLFVASGNLSEIRSEPKISPDGLFVAYSRSDNLGNKDIYIVASDGSGEEQVISHPAREDYPAWSPDGRYLVFLSDRNRSVDLWGVQVRNGKTIGTPFIIKRDFNWNTMSIDLTAEGKLYLFMLGGAEPVNLFEVPVNQTTGVLNSPVTPISVYPTDHSFPRYSPDGKLIAYLSRRGEVGYPKLFVMDEKRTERELPLHDHYATNIAWHPENQFLFFTGWDKMYKPGLFRISIDKDEIKPIYYNDTLDINAGIGSLINVNLLQDAGRIMFFNMLGKEYVDIMTYEPDTSQPSIVLSKIKMPVWGLPSPDGENISYRLGDSLMVVSVSNGEIKHIGSSTPRLEATWSPGGENLVFREGSSLKIFSPEDGSIHTLYQAPEGKAIGGMEMYASSWSPDGDYFIFSESDISESSTNPQKIILINHIDGSIRVIGEAPEGYRLTELRWSPDGSRVIATATSTGTKDARPYEYWMLENFLPK